MRREKLPHWSLAGFVDLVEHAAIREMGRLRFLPSAEDVINGVERNFRKIGRMRRQNRRIARAIEVSCFDFLCILAVEELQIGFGDLAGAVAVGSGPGALSRLSIVSASPPSSVRASDMPAMLILLLGEVWPARPITSSGRAMKVVTALAVARKRRREMVPSGCWLVDFCISIVS